MGSTQHNNAPSSVRQLQDAGKAVAGAAGTVAVDRVRAEVDARSSRAAVELKALAVAIRASAASLREQGHGNEAAMVEQIAARADRLAAHLATASTDELVDNAKRLSQEAVNFARREPTLVVVGAFTVGLLIPKVLDAIGTRRASEHPRSERAAPDADPTAAPVKTYEEDIPTVLVTTEMKEDE